MSAGGDQLVFDVFPVEESPRVCPSSRSQIFKPEDLLLLDPELTASNVEVVECGVQQCAEDGFQWMQRDLRFRLQSGLRMAGLSFETLALDSSSGTCVGLNEGLVGNDGNRSDSAAVVNVLALHGWLDNSFTFRPMAPLLLKHMSQRYPDVQMRIVALDMLGCGQSDHHPVHQYSLFDVLHHSIEVANLLQWTRFGAMGHSYGGAIFSLLPSLLPKSRLAFVIALDVLGFESLPDETTSHRVIKNALVRRLRAQHMQRLGNVHRNSFTNREDAARKLISRYEHGLSFAGAMHLVERGTRGIVERDEDGKLVERFVFTYDSAGQLAPPFYRFTANQMTSFIERIQCPALVLLPKEGTGWPYSSPAFENRLHVIQKSNKSGLVRVVHSEATGHHFHLDSPAVVARDVAPFLFSIVSRELDRSSHDSADDMTAIRSRM